ncbi:MAG: ATP-binding cassette domain-containing protein [Streptococcaceae bacterium]|jgi:NitT/TauT family transport system ATP-binding protein|nr:ATP-binding cassette domain-containing protein [Streptococcaceae bacterium]
MIHSSNRAIQLRSVTYQNVFKGLSTSIREKKITTIVGKSGVGKSTFLKLVSGLLTADSGEVYSRFQEQPISYVPQHYGLLPWETPEKMIRNMGKITKMKDSQTIHEMIETLGIEEVMKKYPDELSGGQAQRVAILRAFSMESSLLLLDEPFSALDGGTRALAKKEFLNIWSSEQRTCLLVTHDIQEAVEIGQDCLVLKPSGAFRYFENIQARVDPIEEIKKEVQDG